MPLGEVQQRLARLHIPHLDVRIVAAADKAARDAVDVQAAHQILVRLHLAHTLASVSIPDTDNLVITSRGDVAAIFGELTASETLAVADKLADVLASVDIPKLHLEVAAARHNRVTPHLHRIDRPVVTAELPYQCTCRPIPNADGYVLGTRHNVLVVKYQVENRCVVVAQASNRSVA